jgi:hypothetical protein
MRIVWFLLATCLAGCVAGEEGEAGVAERGEGLVVANAFYPGSTVTLSAGDNDAVWLVNQSDAIWTESTRLTATVNHGGALNVAGSGLDHIAVGVRGLSVEGAFQQMGLPLQTGTFLFGESVSRAGLTPTNLKSLTSGRGVTFWAVGASQCFDKLRPCARFENYTFNHSGPGLIAGPVALNLTTAPFQLTLTSDAYDMSFSVAQGGVVKGSGSCRAVGGNSGLCGQQPDDVGAADAFVAFVNHDPIAGRTVGGTNIGVAHISPNQQPPCPGCQPF